MQAAMHVRVVKTIDVVHHLDHSAWLLRRGGVIEVDERLAIDLPVKDREIRADALHIVCRARLHPGGNALRG